ncbi:MAG: beta-N-acetylhexosaminidase [Gammaproteobacteria bacterium]|nr:MAG: beta-N-acetylhexosaminidase [Gammaproteobacteria bacterium]
MHGPVVLDLAGPELTESDIARLRHPATGGVILFSRNFASRDQLYRLIREIHELRSPPLLITVDQEGGRVQRFREAFTRLPAAGAILRHFEGDLSRARRAAHELGWLMAAELRAVGVDFSFAPVLDLDHGVSEVIGDRAFGQTVEQVATLAQAWMMGAREAGMVSVGKHFPGHGAVRADSHVALPIDDRPLHVILEQDVRPFRRLIAAGLEGIMPAHVVYSQADSQPAGFSPFWLQRILRGELHFNGVIFSDDLSMKATDDTGGYAERAAAAVAAGCDMVLVCNEPAGADQVLERLAEHHEPLSMARCARLHGRPAPDWAHLRESTRWHNAVGLASEIEERPSEELAL